MTPFYIIMGVLMVVVAIGYGWVVKYAIQTHREFPRFGSLLTIIILAVIGFLLFEGVLIKVLLGFIYV